MQPIDMLHSLHCTAHKQEHNAQNTLQKKSTLKHTLHSPSGLVLTWLPNPPTTLPVGTAGGGTEGGGAEGGGGGALLGAAEEMCMVTQ